ncbi:Coatomer alpha subunit [Spironucleus salmonicida]|uniref:Coatomer alpha subunit n=1 Tax=Spironucleus salmonicida TaxID=348837 RepID=V6LG68_9EUKA|nr:Coatomer alpha subunit [Spironucleus salmonicida]|eukprot:EST42661.1 Coatomer alpha subunit [Spironucleus salmonicida]
MPQLVFNLQTTRVKSVAFHPRRPWVLVACHDGFVELHDYVVGALVERFMAHSAPVRACAFHESQPIFATGSDDRQIKLWDLENRKEIASLQGHTDYIRFIEFHKIRPWIVSASDDCSVKIWNWQSRSCVGSCTGHKEFAMCAKFHPRDDLLATAGLDSTVRVWDLSKISRSVGLKKNIVEKTLQQVLNLPQCTLSISINGESHTRGVNWVSWGENDSLYSSSDDYSVREWRLLRGKPEKDEILGIDATLYTHSTLTGHSGNVNAVEVGKDNVVVSASSDGTIRVYEQKSKTYIGNLTCQDYGIKPQNSMPTRFWCLSEHPKQSLWAAGHDQGLIIFNILDNQFIASTENKGQSYFIKNGILQSVNITNSNDQKYNKVTSQVARSGSFGAGKRVLIPQQLLNIGEPYPIVLAYDDGVNKTACTLMSLASQASVPFQTESNIIKINKTQVAFVINGQLNIGTPSTDGVAVISKIQLTKVSTFLINGFESNECLLCYDKGDIDVVQIQDDIIIVKQQLSLPFSPRGFAFSTESFIGIRSFSSAFILDRNYKMISSFKSSSQILSMCFGNLGRGFESSPRQTLVFTNATHVLYLCPSKDISGVITSLNKILFIQQVLGQQMLLLDQNCEPFAMEFDSRVCGLMTAIADDRTGDVQILLKRVKKSNLGNALVGKLMSCCFNKEALQLVPESNILLKQKLSIDLGEIPDSVLPQFIPEYITECEKQQQWRKAFQYSSCEKQAYINVLNSSNEPLNYSNCSIQQRFNASMMMGDNKEFLITLHDCGLTAAAQVFAESRNIMYEVLDADKLDEKLLKQGKALPIPMRKNQLKNWKINLPVEELQPIEEIAMDPIENNGQWSDDKEEPEQLDHKLPEQQQKTNEQDNWSSEGSSHTDSNLPDLLNPNSQVFRLTGLSPTPVVKNIIEKAKNNNNQLQFDAKSTETLFKQAIDQTTQGNFTVSLESFKTAFIQYKFLNLNQQNQYLSIAYIRGLMAEIMRQQVQEPRQLASLLLIFAQQSLLPQHRAKALKSACVKLKKNNFGNLARMCGYELQQVGRQLKSAEYEEKAQQYLHCKGGEEIVTDFDFSVNFQTMKIVVCKFECQCCGSGGEEGQVCAVCEGGVVE